MNSVKPKHIYLSIFQALNAQLPTLFPGCLLLGLLVIVTYSTNSYASSAFSLNVNTMRVEQDARSSAKKQLNVQSSQQAAQMAKARLGGKVLKVQKQNTGYRVKLIKNNGHIVSVFVDARSGRVSGGK